MQVKSLYRSIFSLTCPRCREGNLFDEPGLFRFKNVLNMPSACPNCEQVYQIEPGFWIGALWASYPIIILIEIPFLLMAIYWQNDHVWIVFAGMLLAFILFFPLMLRLGRSIWIHLFIPFKG